MSRALRVALSPPLGKANEQKWPPSLSARVFGRVPFYTPCNGAGLRAGRGKSLLPKALGRIMSPPLLAVSVATCSCWPRFKGQSILLPASLPGWLDGRRNSANRKQKMTHYPR